MRPVSQRAVIYVRVSTEDQTLGYGLETQLAECQKYAERKGFNVVEVYEDRGISGTYGAEDRDGLFRVLADAKAGKFDVVILYAWDRLARALDIALEVLPQLMRTGVTVIEARSDQPFQGIGTLVGLVTLWTADEDHKKILARTKLGHIQRAKNKKVAGPPPYGYDRTPDGGLVINEIEAEVVRRIFHLYLDEGYGVDKIAALLNSEGIKTKRAKANEEGKNKFIGAGRWQRSTIICIFRNSVYKGLYVYGKTKGKVPHDREHRPNPKRPVSSKDVRLALKNRDHLPHEVVTFEVPAIVDAEAWERVQAIRSKRAESGPIKRLREGATKYTYVFPGLVRCHLCRRVMTPWKQPFTRKRTGTQGVRGYYVCRNKDHACPNLNKYHDLRSVDFQIVGRIIPYLHNPDLVREGLSEMVITKQQQHAALQAQFEALSSRREKAERELQRLIDAMREGALSPAELKALRQGPDTQLETLEKEKVELQEKLTDLAIDDDVYHVEQVVSLFKAIASAVEEEKDPLMAGARALDFYEGVDLISEDGGPPEVPPEADIVKIVRGLVKEVSVGMNSEIIDYKLRVDPSKLPPRKLPEAKSGHVPKKNRSKATPIGEPAPAEFEMSEPRNYKAKRNSITMPFSKAQGIEWPLPIAAPGDSIQPSQAGPGR
ncbi:hypothetical protein D3C72_445360 [compost metagenome]